MKLEYFTKLPTVTFVYGPASKREDGLEPASDGLDAVGVEPSGTAYLRASDIVCVEECIRPEYTYTSVRANATNYGESYLTSLTPAEVVTEIARANDAVKADAEKEMADMMSKMQGTMSLNTGSDVTYGDSN